MKVLVTHEYSGIVRDAFLMRGHDAWSCDIIETESRKDRHIQGDAIKAIKDFKPDLLISHVPCTYLSRVGARWFKTEKCRWARAIEAKKHFMDIFKSDVKMICIENPNPYRNIGLPQSQQVIQPYFFGSLYSKSTHLWLKNLPPLVATIYNTKHISYVTTTRSAKERARFFPEVANAMAEQWG